MRKIVLAFENETYRTRFVPTAKLSENFSTSAIDGDVIRGVRILEVGRLAQFKDDKGTARSFTVTPELIKGLLGFANGKDIPAHLSHDYSNAETLAGKQDRVHALLGVHKDVRIDEATGNLISDLHTMPNEAGRSALWVAKNSPTTASLSAVFSYNPLQDGNRTLAIPLDFQAADLVGSAAATTALLAEHKNTDMTKEETQALLSEALAPITAQLAALKPEPPKVVAGDTYTKTEVAELIKAELSKHTLDDKQIAEIGAKAEASVVAKLGTGGFQFNEGAQKEKDAYTAKLAEYSKTAPNPATAVARMLKDHPELYAARQNAIRAQLSIA